MVTGMCVCVNLSCERVQNMLRELIPVVYGAWEVGVFVCVCVNV